MMHIQKLFFSLLCFLLILSVGCDKNIEPSSTGISYFDEPLCSKKSKPENISLQATNKDNDHFENLVLSIQGINKDQGVSVQLCDNDLNVQISVNSDFLSQSHNVIKIPVSKKHTSIRELLIQWDDGNNSRLFHIPVNQKVTIKHPINNPALGLNLLPAINKVLNYARHVELQPIEVLMLDRLITNYHLKNQIDTNEKYHSYIKQAPNQQIKQQLLVAARIMDASIQSSQEAILATPWPDIIIFTALHCDRYPLPDNTTELWLNELEKGGYPATHILLAFQWAQDNKCQIENLPENFADLASDKVISEINPSDGLDDLEIEAMSWVVMLNHEEKIKPAWIKLMLQQQRPDGGWAAEPDGTASNAHTSGLAAWLLLDLYFYNQSYGSHIDTKTY